MNLDQITDDLVRKTESLTFGGAVAYVYNPLIYARVPHNLYLAKYGQGKREIVFVGMNPGPWGMAQTGVPFGDVPSVRDWMGVSGPVGKPPVEHPARPVLGFDCPRREASGTRLWGWAGKRFGPAEAFFERFFVANYCPLCFLEKNGTNRTPDKLPKAERDPLLAACDEALRRQVERFGPKWVVGVGAWAESRVRAALAGQDVTFGRIPHPSPLNPGSRRGWDEQVDRALHALGIEY
jgi:single-strand selective monofunctional uracil DNA glycosylase